MVKKLQYFFVLLSLASVFVAFRGEKKGGAGEIKIIVIDPGHGGKDPGCQGSIHKEKEVALAVALKLGKFIEQNFKDVKVVYTRTSDVFVELEDRAQIANKAKADLFISIHCNAAGKPVMIKDAKTGKKRPKTYKNKKGKLVVVEKPNPVPFGTETYVMGLKNEAGKMKVATRENSAIFYEDDYEKKYGGFDPESIESYIIMSNYTSAYVIQSANLAVKIQEEYTKKAGRIDKGVHRQSIWVLWRTSMPSILTEIGYLTNPLEETFLGSEKGQDYLAKALFRGLRKYKDETEGVKKEYNDEFENQTPLDNENILAGNIPGQKKSEDEDDEDDNLEKKIETKITTNKPEEIKKPETKPTEKLIADNKEKINDGKYTEINVKKNDSLQTLPLKEDTVLSAKDIADKFKKDNNKPVVEKKEEKKSEENKNATEKKPEVRVLVPVNKEKPIEVAKSENEIVFKVQFASSDVAMNLKQEKFSVIKDGDFYTERNILKYTSGNFNLLSDAISHKNFLRENGFKDCFVIALKKGERMDINEAKKITKQ
jgi:N-acetylmuramoyl-L-alanine amidase